MQFSLVKNGLGQAEIVLKEIEQMTEEQFLPIVGSEKGKILAEIVRRNKPKCVLEIGTLIGYSAIIIGKELDANAHLITIEIDENEAKMAQENIRRAGIRARVEVFVGDALIIIPRLDRPFDFVFIDAEKTEYFQYLKLVEHKLYKGTIVVADNVVIFAKQMKDYLNYVRNSPRYSSKTVRVGQDGLEISIKL
jgi:predicted O-methyltransferase YrrM